MERKVLQLVVEPTPRGLQVIAWPVGDDRETTEDLRFFDLEDGDGPRSRDEILASVQRLLGNEVVLQMALTDDKVAGLLTVMAQPEHEPMS